MWSQNSERTVEKKLNCWDTKDTKVAVYTYKCFNVIALDNNCQTYLGHCLNMSSVFYRSLPTWCGRGRRNATLRRVSNLSSFQLPMSVEFEYKSSFVEQRQPYWRNFSSSVKSYQISLCPDARSMWWNGGELCIRENSLLLFDIFTNQICLF